MGGRGLEHTGSCGRGARGEDWRPRRKEMMNERRWEMGPRADAEGPALGKERCVLWAGAGSGDENRRS